MHPSLTSTYLVPAIFLNPVLFLHSVNTILSRMLPPVAAAGTVQPPPYSPLGPSANYPHLDVHASDNFCWSYTIVMVLAQLFAFSNISSHREARQERKERRETPRQASIEQESSEKMNGHSSDYRGGGGKSESEDGEDSSSASMAETEEEVIL